MKQYLNWVVLVHGTSGLTKDLKETFIDYSTPFTLEQNGKEERFNSLFDRARSIIKDANILKK